MANTNKGGFRPTTEPRRQNAHDIVAPPEWNIKMVLHILILSFALVLSGCADLFGPDDENDNLETGVVGPAGGWVFYEDEAGDFDWTYLEAAPEDTDWADVWWGGYGTLVGAGAQGTAIGTGATNTAAIVAAYGENEPYASRSDYAARLATELVYNGFDDWFLPSRDELDLMFENLHLRGIGGFAPQYYWSSSEYSATRVWYRHFGNGIQGNLGASTSRVRAIRAY